MLLSTTKVKPESQNKSQQSFVCVLQGLLVSVSIGMNVQRLFMSQIKLCEGRVPGMDVNQTRPPSLRVRPPTYVVLVRTGLISFATALRVVIVGSSLRNRPGDSDVAG